jgi:glycine betaine/proline transport system substrate-binding protein
MKRSSIIRLIILFALAISICSCTKKEDTIAAVDAAGKQTTESLPTIKLVYVEWSSEVASTNVVAAVLQEKLGFKVEMTAVSAAAMWQSVATGDRDAMVAAWLPTTHETYLNRVSETVVDLGPNLTGTRIGLVVPAYVEIDSIDQLQANADKFRGQIIGIEPGAGLMEKTEKVFESYGLSDYDLISGSGATMTAALAEAIRRNQPIVVTGWTPHWKFGRWSLKYLDDPRGIYGEAESIHTIVRKGLKEEIPEVYRFLDKFHWTPEQMTEVMVLNTADEADPYENAKKWIAANPQIVESWLAK